MQPFRTTARKQKWLAVVHTKEGKPTEVDVGRGPTREWLIQAPANLELAAPAKVTVIYEGRELVLHLSNGPIKETTTSYTPGSWR
jgi:hypothetical protein